MAQSSAAVKARYREKHREALKAKGREYAARMRREQGMPALGTPESTLNRRTARKATGADHGNWKGGEASYFALHIWVNRWATRTGVCSHCGTAPPPSNRKPGTEWANISGQYLRDLSDYIELCKPCHGRFDSGGITHGTATGYSHYRCRCAECRNAHRLRALAYRTEVRHR